MGVGALGIALGTELENNTSPTKDEKEEKRTRGEKRKKVKKDDEKEYK